ncbi:hypothetical protein GW932_02000 [archaeon]|nr:hypothetical protein [archaeon]
METIETKVATTFSKLISELEHIPAIIAHLITKEGNEYQIGITEEVNSYYFPRTNDRIRPAIFLLNNFPLVYVGAVPKTYAGLKLEHSEYLELKEKLKLNKNKFQKTLENFIPNILFDFGYEENLSVTTSKTEWKNHGGPCVIHELSQFDKKTLEILPFKIQVIEQFRKSIDSEITEIYYELLHK